MKRKAELGPILRALKSEFAEVLRLDQRDHFAPVSSILADTVSSRDLPESKRDDKEIKALRDLYVEMKNTYDALPNGYDQLPKRREDYGLRFKAAVEKMELNLGIDPKRRYAQSSTIVKIFAKK